MYIFKVHGKEYRVRFTYRMICDGDLLDKVSDMTNFGDADAKGVMSKLVKTTAELLLAGLQKYNSKEFSYSTDKEKEERIAEMLDTFDDYEDESTEEHPQSAFTLFQDLQDELEKNGFLSAMMRSAAEAEQMEQMERVATQTMTEMENEPARTKVIDMTHTEKES